MHPVPLPLLPPQRGYESDIPVLDEVPTLESILNQVRGEGWVICELDEVGCVYRGMCVVFHFPPPQDADDTLSVEELGLEDGLVDMELLGSQGAESWKDTITRGDNGLASQYTSSVTAHTKPLSLPACHVPHLCWLYLYSFPPLPLCPLPLHSSILLPPSPVPPFWSSTLSSASLLCPSPSPRPPPDSLPTAVLLPTPLSVSRHSTNCHGNSRNLL